MEPISVFVTDAKELIVHQERLTVLAYDGKWCLVCLNKTKHLCA